MTTSTLKTLPIERIEPSGLNPRKTFDPDELAELTKSVKRNGIIQPIVVRPTGKGLPYQIVAGERRYKAALAAKLTEVPVTIRELTDEQVVELAVTENEQRADVNLFEKAEGYAALIEQYGAKIDDVAAKIGKSVSTVRSLLKLRNLPEQSKKAMAAGTLSPSIAGLIASRPTEQMRADCEAYVFEDGDEDLPTFEDLKEWIQNTQTRQLKGAPFNPKCKKLLPQAGSCTACPKRAGNMPDALPGARADICTDVECFERKVAAGGQAQLASAEKAGHTIVDPEVARNWYPFGDYLASNAPVYRWGQGCYFVPGKEGLTYQELFEKHIDPADLQVCQLPSGEVAYHIDKDRALELAKKHYNLKLQTSGERATRQAAKFSKEEHKKREQERLAKMELANQAMQRFHQGKTTAEVPEHTAEVLRLMAVDAIKHCYIDAMDELLNGRGLTSALELEGCLPNYDLGQLLTLLAEVEVLERTYSYSQDKQKEVASLFGGKGGAK